MARRVATALLVVGLIASGCSAVQPTPSAQPSPSPRYTGFVSLGTQVQAFGPCGQAEQWWIVDTPKDVTDRYQLAASSAYHPVYVVLEGNVDAAKHGPDGTFNRELRITRLVEMDGARKGC